MLNAKKSLSTHQLARDLGLNQKTAWRIEICIRAEMARKGGALLQGIIEADELERRIKRKIESLQSVDVARIKPQPSEQLHAVDKL